MGEAQWGSTGLVRVRLERGHGRADMTQVSLKEGMMEPIWNKARKESTVELSLRDGMLEPIL